MKKAIKCGTLFDATGKGCAKKDMTILIEDNRITGVVPTAEFVPGEEQVIDLSDKFVMPGLIDAHVHLMFNSDRGGRTVIYQMSTGEIALKSLAMANIDLQAGFTTVRVMSANDFTDVAVKRAIEAGYCKGPRIFASGEPIGCVSGNGDTAFNKDIVGGEIGMMVNGPVEAAGAVRRAIKFGADQIKLSAANAFLDFGDFTGAPELSYEELKAAVDIAHMNNRITAAHTYSAESINNAVRAGVDTIEHVVWIDDETLDLMKEKGTYMVPTTDVLIRMEENADQMGFVFGVVGKNRLNLQAAIKHHAKQVAKARDMGIKIGFGSDTGTPFNVHGTQAYEFKCLVDEGLTEEEALLAATKTNAEMLRLNDKIGTIEAGKLADVVAFDANPLENIMTMMSCTFVMKDGDVYKC